MKVNHSGRIKVSTYVHGGFVGLDIIHGDDEMPANMTAAKARKLARKLLAAADEIDPPTIAPTHWATEPSATDAATLAPIIAKDEPAAPYVPQVGDVVDVIRHGIYYAFAHAAMPVRAEVVSGAPGIVVRAASGREQYVDESDIVLVSRPAADAPDVDPAEPRGGCCGGGC